MNEHYFQTHSMSVGYNGEALIRDICLEIRKGEIVVLIGPNGSGKSTILKSITRHLKLIGGNVALAGKDLADVSHAQLSKSMAVVLTERIRPELMTCFDVVAMGRYPYTGRLGILSDHDREIVWEALRAVRAQEIADKPFDVTSDGQKQRILLARALCQEPELIVLDEPTSFLDIRHKLELLRMLREMAVEKEITVVMSLHEIDLAQKFADRIVCVKGDVISCVGTPEDVFAGERIHALYDLEEGSYDAVYGSVEFPRVEGTPRAAVLSNGGSGAGVYRRLQREGIPFAAGILSPNDADYRMAKRLAVCVIEEKPFEPIGSDAVREMKEAIDRSEFVIVTEMMFGTMNDAMREIIQYAQKKGKIKQNCMQKNTIEEAQRVDYH